MKSYNVRSLCASLLLLFALAFVLVGCGASDGGVTMNDKSPQPDQDDGDPPVVQDDVSVPAALCGGETLTYADGTGGMCLSVEWPAPNPLSVRHLINPETQWIHAKASAGAFAVHADIVRPATDASLANIPVGNYLVEGTAWKTDPFVGGVLLSYGSAPATVSAGQTTPVGITLAPSSATFTSPLDFVYGSPSPQTIDVVVSFENWPLSLRQAEMDVYVVDYFSDPFTVFEPLCTSGQTLLDVTVRGCSGTLPSTLAISALPVGSAYILVVVAGESQGMSGGIFLLSGSLPNAP